MIQTIQHGKMVREEALRVGATLALMLQHFRAVVAVMPPFITLRQNMSLEVRSFGQCLLETSFRQLTVVAVKALEDWAA
jgi:hypothetical protein